MERERKIQILLIVMLILLVVTVIYLVGKGVRNNKEKQRVEQANMGIEVHWHEEADYLDLLQIINYFNISRYKGTPKASLILDLEESNSPPIIQLKNKDTDEVIREGEYKSVEDFFRIVQGGKMWEEVENGLEIEDYKLIE